jgi:hypothetical protein
MNESGDEDDRETEIESDSSSRRPSFNKNVIDPETRAKEHQKD